MVENLAALAIAVQQPELTQVTQPTAIAQRTPCNTAVLADELRINRDPALRTFSCFAVPGYAVMSFQGYGARQIVETRYAAFVLMDGRWRFTASSSNADSLFLNLPEWASRDLRQLSGWR